MSLPQSFTTKKKRILELLAVPDSEYDDLSPKGSVDEGIKDLISEINSLDGCVTTSSCAGRISVFLEGEKKKKVNDELELGEGERTTTAGVGGKGGGGRWLFVSHDPVDLLSQRSWIESCGMVEDSEGARFEVDDVRLVHFKFEPMILHVLTASLSNAQAVLSAALQAGFRESGALNLLPSGNEPATPMVGIRTMGLALESLVGFEKEGKLHSIIPEWQLRNLLEISNQRFVENAKRIERFRTLLKEVTGGDKEKKGANGAWEDKDARRERKRAEGLRRAEEKKSTRSLENENEEMPDLHIMDKNL